MRGNDSRRGITMVEVLVVLVVIGLLIALLIPALLWLSEIGRYPTCRGRLQEFGSAIVMFDEINGTLPKSHLRPAAESDKPFIFNMNSRGWSWTFQITPYLRKQDLFDLINLEDPADNPDQYTNKIRRIAEAEIPVFRCPSFSSSRWVEFETTSDRPGSLLSYESNRCMISNYKVVSASTMESLAVAYGGPLPTGYGTEHPDGAITPVTNYSVEAIGRMDGTSNTIMLTESAERRCSRWIYGNETEMIGLPDTIALTMHEGSDFKFAYPRGFDPKNPKWYEDSQIDPGENGSGLPFAAWTYTGTEIELTYRGKQTNNPDARYGPSSCHPERAHHLFCDTSVFSISNKVDAAAYYFMITRNGGDPEPPKIAQ